mmetsp:Transcript_27709/g.40807  ORF Transcript_27709/g.40807 Transcript_27709/m.40807 type:complete len:500 (-) Transcript_27709:2963-4462(-)|eukprot:6774031-Ditylum_brightwellii.AAC.1
MQASNIEISGKASLNQLDVTTISAKKDLVVDGSISSFGYLSIKKDCKIGEKLTSNSIDVKYMKVDKELSAHSISSKGTISTSGKVIANNFESDGSLLSQFISATNIEVKDTFKATNGTLTGDLIVGRNIEVKGNISSKDSIMVNNVETTADVRAKGNVFSGKDMMVSGKLSIKGAVDGLSAEFRGKTTLNEVAVSNILNTVYANISDSLIVNGNAQVACMYVTNKSVTIGGDLVGASNVTVGENIDAGNSITSKTVVVSGHIISGSGFYSHKGNLECSNVTASGLVTAENGIYTTNFTVDGNATVLKKLSARSVYVSEEINVTRLAVADNIKAKSLMLTTDMSVNGGLKVYNSANISGELAVSEKIFAQEVEVEDQLKAKSLKANSLFSSRVYTEDMAASGFITAATIISKGDATVNGIITANELSIGNSIQSNFLTVTNSIKCVTAEVAGMLNAAGIVTQKASVGGMDIVAKLAEMESLKSRVEELELLVKSLTKQEH